jgi:hypothetical protein
VPLTSVSTRRLPHLPHTSLAAQSGTVVSAPSLRHLCRIGLDLVSAILAPNDQADTGRSVPERHRRARAYTKSRKSDAGKNGASHLAQ